MLKFIAANYEAVAAFFLFASFCIFLVHRGYDMRVQSEHKQEIHKEKVKDAIRDHPHSADVVNSRWMHGNF